MKFSNVIMGAKCHMWHELDYCMLILHNMVYTLTMTGLANDLNTLKRVECCCQIYDDFMWIILIMD